MDKLVGLGAAGVNIVDEFSNFPQNRCYRIDAGLVGLKKDGYCAIGSFGSTEEYEKNCPSIKSFLKNARPEIGLVMAGSGKISGLS